MAQFDDSVSRRLRQRRSARRSPDCAQLSPAGDLASGRHAQERPVAPDRYPAVGGEPARVAPHQRGGGADCLLRPARRLRARCCMDCSTCHMTSSRASGASSVPVWVTVDRHCRTSQRAMRSTALGPTSRRDESDARRRLVQLHQRFSTYALVVLNAVIHEFDTTTLIELSSPEPLCRANLNANRRPVRRPAAGLAARGLR